MSGGWAVRLSGDDWSLQGLGLWFAQKRCKVSREEDGSYYLTSPDLVPCNTEDAAWEVAVRIVSHINSAAKVLNQGQFPVHAAALIRTEPDGTRRSSVRASVSAHAIIRDRWSAEVVRDGEVVAPSSPSLAERIVRLQEREGAASPVARALAQWNLPEQTPTSLNNILEIIRDDVSGDDPDRGRTWGTMVGAMAPLMAMREGQLDDELRRCRDSLHDPTTVGPLARHGSPRHVANPMDMEQAKDFVHRLLLAWLRGKI